MNRIYMDYAATTPPLPEVVEAMLPYLQDKFGNPSSIHSFGQEARAAVEDARKKAANLINAAPEEIVFTSGGTESDNFALNGVLGALKDKNHIITSKIEHHAILEPCHYLEKQGYKVTYLDVDKDGMVNPENVKTAITDKTALVSIMHANNEIGTIEPIAEISKVINKINESRATSHESQVYFHTDAVQTVGEINVDVKELGVDLLSASAHKFYGPKGVGFLYVKKGTRMIPFIRGGAQEKNRRGSTENVPGIIGMGKAAEIAKVDIPNRIKHLTVLRDLLIDGLLAKIPDSFLNGHRSLRLPKNTAINIKYVEGESMLLNLDMEGIAASTGSACSSQSLEPSHVLLAIGVSPENAHGSIRFSLGRLNTKEDVKYVLEVFPKIVEKLRAMSPLGRKNG